MPSGIHDVADETDEAENHHEYHRRVGQMQLANALQSQRDGEHEGAEKQETDGIEGMEIPSPRQKRHVFEGSQYADDADGDIDQENPVP